MSGMLWLHCPLHCTLHFHWGNITLADSQCVFLPPQTVSAGTLLMCNCAALDSVAHDVIIILYVVCMLWLRYAWLRSNYLLVCVKPSLKVCLLQGTKSLCCQSREQSLKIDQDARKQFLHGSGDLETLQMYSVQVKHCDKLWSSNQSAQGPSMSYALRDHTCTDTRVW